MKSILIIETPKECWECPLHMQDWDDDFEEIMVCNAENLESHYGKIPNYCPLKPLPQKILDIYEAPQDYRDGWNDCIDEVTGEEEK